MSQKVNPGAELQPPFAEFMGMKITHLSKDKVEAEIVVREELNNRFGAMHGGAVMALADNLGGTARAECTPLHRGRTTMVWQTRITRNDGRLCALVTQTQIVIAPEQG
jgi:acyl-coenzyme A thioesterase PaaI-like protein